MPDNNHPNNRVRRATGILKKAAAIATHHRTLEVFLLGQYKSAYQRFIFLGRKENKSDQEYTELIQIAGYLRDVIRENFNAEGVKGLQSELVSNIINVFDNLAEADIHKGVGTINAMIRMIELLIRGLGATEENIGNKPDNRLAGIHTENDLRQIIHDTYQEIYSQSEKGKDKNGGSGSEGWIRKYLLPIILPTIVSIIGAFGGAFLGYYTVLHEIKEIKSPSGFTELVLQHINHSTYCVTTLEVLQDKLTQNEEGRRYKQALHAVLNVLLKEESTKSVIKEIIKGELTSFKPNNNDLIARLNETDLILALMEKTNRCDYIGDHLNKVCVKGVIGKVNTDSLGRVGVDNRKGNEVGLILNVCNITEHERIRLENQLLINPFVFLSPNDAIDSFKKPINILRVQVQPSCSPDYIALGTEGLYKKFNQRAGIDGGFKGTIHIYCKPEIARLLVKSRTDLLGTNSQN